MISLKEILKTFLIKEERYETEHKSYGTAVKTALRYAEKIGYDYDTKLADKLSKETSPSAGKTKKVVAPLTKRGETQKEKIFISVFNTGSFKRDTKGVKVRSLHGGAEDFELNVSIKE